MEEDKKLYNNFLSGDKKSLDILIAKYKNNIVYFISRYVKNIEIAEDIFQDVILYVLENKNKYDPNYSFKTYLYIIAKSKALNYINTNKIHEDVLNKMDCSPVDNDLLEEIIFSNERKIKIQKVIKKLKTNHQIVIYLTQIEGLTYKETARIMGITEKQVKNLVYNAKKSLKKLLIEEKVIEIKQNKFIRLLSWILIIIFVSTGIVFATKTILNKINNAKLNPSFSGTIGNVNENNIWVGTFQLVWNELIEKLGMPIEFDNGKSELAENLNKKSFTKDSLHENSYYIKEGKIDSKLKAEIENDLKDKFNTNSEVLNNIDWKSGDTDYLLYSILKKKFTFKSPFIERHSQTFGLSNEKVKYFGLDASSIEDAFDQVTILFYNSNNDFAIKIDTLENEEVILYRTNNFKTFEENYIELENKANAFTGSKTMFRGKDDLKIPFIKVNAIINYDELCNRTIKNTKQYCIKYAIQTVEFELNNYGGNLTSEALVNIYQGFYLESPRAFDFTDTFILYLKETDKKQPYFALYVDNIDVLIQE